jgi:DNA polymerase III subunit epsilon
MREIVFDTETTGLDPATGDRIVEIGAIELINHVPSGRTFHVYLNPERPMSPEAFAIHGLGDDFLRDKPVFRDKAQDFVTFIGDAKLIAHNAMFDMKFINAELQAVGFPTISVSRAIDTAAMARSRFPGAPASLDALCRRFGIDNSGRTLHGALLDSTLLAEVYLELIGGRQPGLTLATAAATARNVDSGGPARRRPTPLPARLTEGEKAAHAAFVEKLGPDAVWKRVGG